MLSVGVVAVSAVLSAQRNVIFLQCDEMDGRVMDPATSGTSAPYYDVVPTPHLDKMMTQGVTFNGHYCANPLCAPSRASTFAGRFASTIEAWSNVKPIVVDVTDPTKPDPNCVKVPGYSAERCTELGRRQNMTANSTLNHLFAAGGYDVQLYGKMDTGGGPSMTPKGTHATGFHMPGGTNWTGTWGPGHPELAYYPADILHSWANSANISEAIFAKLDAPNKWIDLESPKGCPSQGGDWKAISDCVTFLEQWKEGDPPFFLYCSVVDPHPPYWSNSTWMAGINETALNLTLAAAGPRAWGPVNKMHLHDHYGATAEGVPLEDSAEMRDIAYRMNKAYYGQIAETDAMMGAVLDALSRSAAADNTYALFTSDHGEMRAEHRMVEKMTHYEGSARVPLIIKGPGVPAGGPIVGNLTSLVDVVPTFLDMAGLPKPSYLDGHSLAPFIGLPHAQPRPQYVVSEYMGEASNTGSYMYREGLWKLIAFGRDPPYQNYEPQLFHLGKDPMELEDLSSKYPEVVQKLDAKLRKVLDYPTINTKVIKEGRENVKLWMSLYKTEADWKANVRKAYAAFTDDDMGRFERWVNASGEYAPVNA